MSVHWYAIASHPNKEDTLWRQLLSKNIEVFYPRTRVQTVNPRARKVRAYFPGYMFIHVDVEVYGISTFQYMPYAKGLISFGGEPSIVPDALIFAIQKRVGEIAKAGGELFDSLKPGDTVVIQNGPFAGYEAIFDLRLPGSERVRILLKMLSERQVPIELQAGQIQKKRTSKK